MDAGYVKNIFNRAKQQGLGLWLRFSHGFEIILITKKPENPEKLNFLPVVSVEAEDYGRELIKITYEKDEAFGELLFETENLVSVTSADPERRQEELTRWQVNHAAAHEVLEKLKGSSSEVEFS